MSTHLGRRISALVDDQLPCDERARALEHVAGCPSCAFAVESERRAKLTVRSLRCPEPSATMLQDLFSLARPGAEPGDGPGGFPGPGGRTVGWGTGERPAGGAPAGRPGLLRVPSRPVRYTLAAFSVAGASLGMAFVAGGPVAGGATPGPAAPAVVPAFDRTGAQYARGTAGGLFTEPAAVSQVVGVRSSPAPLGTVAPRR